jgi:hypothetical protein
MWLWQMEEQDKVSMAYLQVFQKLEHHRAHQTVTKMLWLAFQKPEHHPTEACSTVHLHGRVGCLHGV